MSSSLSGHDLPRMRVRPPGPATLAARARQAAVFAPMGPTPREVGEPLPTLVMREAFGANVLDVDDNLYVDLAAGFGALLLGHSHPSVVQCLEQQSTRLMQALGDVYPSDQKLALGERLTALYGEDARVIVGQSGSDAVSAALKTAQLFTGRSGIVAFQGAYHGLGYGPLAACGLRDSYREPFSEQLNPHVHFADYPSTPSELDRSLSEVERTLREGGSGAILVEPILGRGGVVVPPAGFLRELSRLADEYAALLIADEIWTGLGRSGKMLFSEREARADLVCLGKGLGGGLPISAVVGHAEVMQAWQRPREVVHTSTFAGAPLSAACALSTLDVLQREELPARAEHVGARFRAELEPELARRFPSLKLRGAGLMIGLDLGAHPGKGSRLQERLLTRGYLTSTGGGRREVLVLTPALIIDERLLAAFTAELLDALGELEGTA